MAERSSELNEFNETENETTIQIRTSEPVDVETRTQTGDITTEEIADDPAEIREQIEETRREMSETLDAIQEKLSISNITEQVKDQVSEQITGAVETFKHSTAGATLGQAQKIMKNLGQSIKKTDFKKMASDNPLPLVLVGLGIGLLVISRARKGASKKQVKYRYEAESRSNYDTESRNTQSGPSTQAQIGEKARGVYQNVSDSAGAAYGSVSDTASKTYEKIGNLSGQLRNQYSHQLEENPLAVGAVALAVGAAVGMAIPSTRYEGELMGEARENLVSKAQGAAREAISKVEEVVGQAKEVISEQVQKSTGNQ